MSLRLSHLVCDDEDRLKIILEYLANTLKTTKKESSLARTAEKMCKKPFSNVDFGK